MPLGSSVFMVKATVIFSRAQTHNSPSKRAGIVAKSPGTDAGRLIPHPFGRRNATTSIGTARMRLPMSFCAMILA